MLYAKFNAKLCNIYAKSNGQYARLALNELKFCKVYAKFNAKDVRSTLNSIPSM